MDENLEGIAISPKKLEANRRNAQLSTGPTTEEGKSWSRRNALKHGILASALLITEGEGSEDPAEFEELLGSLHHDLAPVGALEEMLLEKVAVCLWRNKRALKCEAGLVRREIAGPARQLDDLVQLSASGAKPEHAAITDHLSLPLGPKLDRILRYEATIQRQMAYAINQLERLQRTRKGENVPAPVSVQVSNDQ
jgi:hypothetical protein